MTSPSFFAVLAFAAVGLGHAGAAVLFSDPFTDGDLVAGADNSGISWYDRSANTEISIIADTTGINNGNALQMAANSASAITNRGIVGVLSQSLTLAAPGDYLTLSFSFRFISTNGSTSPGNANGGFTFGFYNSNGTTVTANNANTSDNDFGFRGEFGSGANPAVAIFKETNSGAGGLGTGADGGAVTVVNPVNVQVNDFLPHTGSITLTYNSPTDLAIALMYDGAAVGSGTSSVPFLTFDELVFSQGGSNGFNLDNVVVESNIPEPGTAALMGLCAVLGLAGHRRR